MKITFQSSDSRSIAARFQETFTPDDLGFTEEEWKSLSDEQKLSHVRVWLFEHIDYTYIEE
jgi:hypothetical protein